MYFVLLRSDRLEKRFPTQNIGGDYPLAGAPKTVYEMLYIQEPWEPSQSC